MKKIILIFKGCLYLLILSFVFTVKVEAKTLYVSKNGNNSDGTSWEKAWNEMDKIVWANINHGDTLYIDGGQSSMTYSNKLKIDKSGSSGTGILTVKKSTESGHNGTAQLNSGIDIYGNNILVQGLNVQKTSGISGTEDQVVYLRSGDNVTVNSLKVIHPTSRGIKVDGYGDEINNIVIKNCNFDTGTSNNNNQVDNIYVQMGSDVIIENNTVKNRNTGTDHVDLIQTYQVRNITVRNNYLEWVSGAGNGVSQATMIQYVSGYVKLYNNVILTNSQQSSNGAYIGRESGGSSIYIWNNTIKAQHSSGTALRIPEISPNSIKAIKNNILIAGSSGGYAMHIDNGVSDPSVVTNNILDTASSGSVAYANGSKNWSAWQAAGFDKNGYNVDANLNVNLQPDSGSDPSVDRGATIGDFSDDITGLSRPQGAAWDIGAYEYRGYGTNPVTPTPTITPTNNILGDYNKDSLVNIYDIKYILDNWGGLFSTAQIGQNIMLVLNNMDY